MAVPSNGETDSLDQESVRQVLDGNSGAFRGIYERHLALTRYIGRRVLGVRGEIDDFVQDVFLKVYASLKSYHGVGRFRSWVARIAFTTASNTAQRHVPAEPIDPQRLTVQSPTVFAPEPRYLIEELAGKLRAAINELPKHHRIVVELMYFFHLKYREISEMTGLPVGTLKARIHRARKQLRDLLDGVLSPIWITEATATP